MNKLGASHWVTLLTKRVMRAGLGITAKAQLK